MCEVCQHNKLHGPSYGKLPPHDAPLAPWEEVHVDLIGPWPITIGNQEVEFNAQACGATV